MSGAERWMRVAAAADIVDGEPFGIEVAGHSIALYRIDGEIFCTDNICTHEFALLSDGWLEGHVIECPLHAGQFDVRTGKGLSPPIAADLKTFPVKIEGGEVLVDLGPS
jgi:nitrite reductase/ring-hydroxylating ferredoxin subunit